MQRAEGSKNCCHEMSKCVEGMKVSAENKSKHISLVVLYIFFFGLMGELSLTTYASGHSGGSGYSGHLDHVGQLEHSSPELSNSGHSDSQQSRPVQSNPEQQTQKQPTPEQWNWEDLPQELREVIRFSDIAFEERLLQYFREKATQVSEQAAQVSEQVAQVSEQAVQISEQAAQASAEPEQASAEPEQSLAKPEERIDTPMPLPSTRTLLHTLAQPEQLDYLELAVVIYEFATMYGYYEEGLETIRAVFERYKSQMDQRTRLEYRFTEADMLSYNRQYAESYALFAEILPLIEDEDLKARILSEMGYVAGQRGQFDQAAAYLFEAAEIFRALDQPRKLAITYNRIGLLYKDMEEYGPAIEYHQEFVDAAEALADSSLILRAYTNLGTTLMESGREPDAMPYYEKAYDFAVQLQIPAEVAKVALNIGNIYKKQEQYNEALKYYDQSLRICEEIGLEYGKILNTVNIGTVYYNKQEYDRGEPYLLEAYNYFKEAESLRELLSVIEYLYDLYDFTGDIERSQIMMREYIELRNELYNIEKTELTEDLRLRYETDLKEQQILLSEAEIREKEAANRVLILLSICLVGLMIGSIGYYLHRNHYLRMLYERNMEMLETMGMEQKMIAKARAPVHESAQNKEYRRNQELFEDLKRLMQNEEVFRDPDLQASVLCKQLGTNKLYLSQAINSMTGMNLNHYINVYRINEAKRLILIKDASIYEIQTLCGFNSKSTFYTAFKKITGMTPKQFLDQHRQVKK